MSEHADERKLGLIMAVITALSWAVLAIALKYALQSFSSGTIVWIRMALAFVILLGLLRAFKRPSWLSILAGALISINYFGFMKGIELTSASNAQIMIQLAPMGFVLLSIFALKERPTKIQLIGMLLALTGFAFFFWDQILVSLDRSGEFGLGNLWIVLAAASWAIFAYLQKVILRKNSLRPQEFNLLIYGLSAVFLLPLADFHQLWPLSGLQIALLLFLAVNTVVAYGALSEALQRAPASHVSMIISVNPLLTIAIMTYLTQIEVEWIHGEPIHWRGFFGAFLVVMGVITTVTSRPALSQGKS